MNTHSDMFRSRLQPERMQAIAAELVGVPSRTGDAKGALDCLGALLEGAGVGVERHEAGHPNAPAVVAWLDSGVAGPTLQFNGHLDVVHLPYEAPRVEGRLLRGSGAADMKGGTAAAVEAFLAIRDAGGPPRGRLLLTAHDLHEAPWGDGRQLDALIQSGMVGDAVLIPEPLWTHLPVRGRGQACWLARVSRGGEAVHEVMHPAEEGYVNVALVELASRLAAWDRELRGEVDAIAGRSSVFLGQIHGGVLYNQSPQTGFVEGTRRWIPGVSRDEVERAMRALVAETARAHGVGIALDYRLVRDAFQLDTDAGIVRAFQGAMESVVGHGLELGPKMFVDDGNSFSSLAGVPAITHGPRAGGQHTTSEWVDLDDMARVARVYVETAARFWGDVGTP